MLSTPSGFAPAVCQNIELKGRQQRIPPEVDAAPQTQVFCSPMSPRFKVAPSYANFNMFGVVWVVLIDLLLCWIVKRIIITRSEKLHSSIPAKVHPTNRRTVRREAFAQIDPSSAWAVRLVLSKIRVGFIVFRLFLRFEHSTVYFGCQPFDDFA